MRSIGIDPDSTAFVMVSMDEDGGVVTRRVPLVKTRDQAARLVNIRMMATFQLVAENDVAVITIEIPWGNPSNPHLMAIHGVLQEAAKWTHPDAVVLATPTQSWKKDTVGRGNATKAEVMAHARARGLSESDQDLADALCMAESGWSRWNVAAAG